MTLDNINIILKNIFEIAKTLNIKSINGINFLPNENIIELTTELDTKYYVYVSNNGSVEKVYKDYMYGEMIYFSGDENLTSNQQNNIQSNNDTIKKISDFVLNQPICPFCGSIELLKYKYGEPTSQIDESKYILGGCLIDGHIPKYKCKKCGKDIYLEDIKNNQTDYSNLSTNELVNKTIDRIDKMIKTLNNEQDNDNSIDNKIVNIDKNLNEVKNYSIINKSIEELLVAKKRFINDWFDLLVNTVDDQWILNSGIYRIHIHSILECVLKMGKDDIAKEQLELINEIGKNVKFPDKLAFLALITKLMELEKKDKTNPLCPKCNNALVFMQPANSLLYCSVCNQYFENDNNKAGKEVKRPPFNDNMLY